jgi:hypothetical protein
MESLKNLPLLNAQTQPLSSASQSFYANTFATGNGPQGTFLLTDFLGTAVGVTVGQYFTSAATIINANTAALTQLNLIYDTMIGVLNGSYPDPLNPPDGIEIPVGLPGAGIYADANDAIQALVVLANAEIPVAQTAMGTSGTTLNTDWNAICARLVYEAGNQAKASLSIPALIAGDKMSVLALISSLNGIGNDTQQGGGAQFFESIANTSLLSGQAIIGALREGRNDTKMDATGIKHDNVVPDTPASPPPQATLLNSEYTVAEARALRTP